jgi:hypothetical protein
MASKVTFKDELLYPSDYLAAFDLAGKDMTLTILTISKQELQLRNGGKKVKPVLTFKETPKKVVLNVTNAESIAIMHGNKAEAWVGRQVTFFPTQVPVGRTMADAIRVRETAPHPSRAGEPPAQPPPEKKPWNIPQSWLDAIPKVKSTERLAELFAAAGNNKWPEDKLKEFGDLLDARAAEIKAEAPPPAERQPGEEG